MDRELYKKIVNACPPEMRQEIKRLDWRTHWVNRKRIKREISIHNIEVIKDDHSELIDTTLEIKRLAEKIPEQFKKIIYLRSVGYKYGEIAESMEISVNRVKTMFSEIRKISTKVV